MEGSEAFNQLANELKFCEKLVTKSKIFGKIQKKLETSGVIWKKINAIMDPRHTKMKLVIYNIGSIQFSWPSKFRFSLCLLLRKRLANTFENIDIFDPTINFCEHGIMTSLGCNVFLNNEPCRKVETPTLLFIPDADPLLLENLLEMNWCTSSLNQMIVFGVSFRYIMEKLHHKVLKQRVRRLIAIEGHVKQIDLCSEVTGLFRGSELVEIFDAVDDDEEDMYIDDQYEDDEDIDYRRRLQKTCLKLALYFFRLNEDSDMESLVPNDSPARKRISEGLNVDGGRPANWYIDPQTLALEEMDELEVARVKEEVENTMEEIKQTDIYSRFHFIMKSDPEVLESISRTLTYPHTSLNLVIYGLGSLEAMYSSQYDLAFGLLLKRHSVLPIGAIEIFQPRMTLVDIKVCAEFGIRVLSVDEQCRRVVEKPTIFFAPRLHFRLVGNIFEANFGATQLNKLIFLGASHLDKRKTIINERFERLRYMWSIERFRRLEVKTNVTMVDSILQKRDLKFTFYRVDFFWSLKKSLLTGIPLTERLYHDYSFDSVHQQSLINRVDNDRVTKDAGYNPNAKNSDIRQPSRYMRLWSLPSQGFTKLNFHGYVNQRKGLAGFGGVFHDAHGDWLLAYAGPLPAVADFNMASLLALKAGLELIDHFDDRNVCKLVIEGDAVSVVRWVNNLYAPPQVASEVLEQVKRMADQFGFWCIGGVYREANRMAIELAWKGAELLEDICIWQQ